MDVARADPLAAAGALTLHAGRGVPALESPPRPDARSLGALVEAARGGDAEAFAALYRRHVRLVYAVLLGSVDPDDAPDLVQDVFLAALGELPRLRDPGAFAGWLTAIARNRAKMHLRARRPDVPLDDDALATLPARGAPPDAPLEAEHVMRQIRALPAKLREPLLLRLVEGMSGEEIAAATGLSHGTVRVYLHEGMRALRERLREME